MKKVGIHIRYWLRPKIWNPLWLALIVVGVPIATVCFVFEGLYEMISAIMEEMGEKKNANIYDWKIGVWQEEEDSVHEY